MYVYRVKEQLFKREVSRLREDMDDEDWEAVVDMSNHVCSRLVNFWWTNPSSTLAQPRPHPGKG
jgi:hypothetical protein